MATAAPLADLNKQFEIPGVARIVQGHGGLPAVRVASPEARGEVYLHGAHVSAWHPVGAEEVLFVSAKTEWEEGVAIRGGVPVCFPWFAVREGGPADSPPHGVVRTKSWRLEAITHADSNVTVALSTTSDDVTRKYVFDDFHLLFCVTFGEQLRLELTVTNRGSLAFKYEEALHAYFRVGNLEAAHLRGLNGVTYIDKTDGHREKPQHGDVRITAETDRVYRNTSSAVEVDDPVLKRRILVSKEDSRDTVLWNPWSEKSKTMKDLAPEDWRHFLCVETCNVGTNSVRLEPGHSHRMTSLVSVMPL
jgi:glucose-6-phosphate 1-epimerase